MARETIKYDNGIEVEIRVEDGITKYDVRCGHIYHTCDYESNAISIVKRLSESIAMEENICKEKDKEWLAYRVAGWKAAIANNGLAIKEV